jgi:hypothetical protein
MNELWRSWQSNRLKPDKRKIMMIIPLNITIENNSSDKNTTIFLSFASAGKNHIAAEAKSLALAVLLTNQPSI